MAGEWLKFECSLPDKPETLAITVAMGWDDPDLTVGKLMRLFRWFDQHTVNGNARGVTAALLDRLIGVTGFVQAVADTGWLVIDEAGLTLHNFDRHNGATAKSRAQTAKRVANHRGNADGNALSNAPTVTPALAREEKKREEKSKEKEPAAPARPSLTADDLLAEGVSREASTDWFAVRKRKKGGPLTPLAWSGFKAEVAKAGWQLEAAVLKCIQRNWVSFEAEWVDKGGPARGLQAVATVPSKAAEQTRQMLDADVMTPEQRARAAEAKAKALSALKTIRPEAA